MLTDFPHIFATSKEGYATDDPEKPGDSMQPLLDMMLDSIPGPEIDPDAPLQMLVTNLDWSDYVGRIAVGRIYSGTIQKGQQVALMQSAEPTPLGRGQGEGALRSSNTLTPALSQGERENTFTLAKVVEVHLFDKLGPCRGRRSHRRRHHGPGRPGRCYDWRHDERSGGPPGAAARFGR